MEDISGSWQILSLWQMPLKDISLKPPAYYLIYTSGERLERENTQ